MKVVIVKKNKKKKQIKLLGGVIYQPLVNVLNMWL